MFKKFQEKPDKIIENLIKIPGMIRKSYKNHGNFNYISRKNMEKHADEALAMILSLTNPEKKNGQDRKP